ncbi:MULTISPECIES: hypothetical protein [Rhodomicrobium]|uniref:hypothetical protein n=1 Tax=Rhodomicrobium TaxID=1068 RepID=UPI000B4B0206|nr:MULTISPECIES: hypothetical protein [Rhodomicrobium]
MRQASRNLRSSSYDEVARRSARQQWQSAVVLAGALAAASFVPHPIVLPLTSVILVAAGCAVAAFAWVRAEKREADQFTRWDQAGIFVFAGFLAALTADSAEALSFIEAFADRSPARE